MTAGVRVRFAPSPTGYLHVGGAKIALINWIFAKQHRGVFLLRIEDTDSQRSDASLTQAIFDGLRWLKLDWDGAPSYQSAASPAHQAAAEKLLQDGKAYKCFCTKDAIAARQADAGQHPNSGYDGHCRQLSADEIAAHENTGTSYAIRFCVPSLSEPVIFHDLVLGEIQRDAAAIEDFVLLRSDGTPVYVLSNTVDDISDRISHVIRGQDHVENTTKQVLLYQAFGAQMPRFAHLPLALDTDRHKISKRKHGQAVTLQYYQELGILPEALCNFLMLLGWNDGSDRELFSMADFIRVFEFDRVSTSNAIFNIMPEQSKFSADPKLLAINEDYIRNLKLEELVSAVRQYLETPGLFQDAELYDLLSSPEAVPLLELLQSRCSCLQELVAQLKLYVEPLSAESVAVVETYAQQTLPHAHWLPVVQMALQQLSAFDAPVIDAQLKTLAKTFKLKHGALLASLRVLCTGTAAGPPLCHLFEIFGKEKVCRRLQKALAVGRQMNSAALEEESHKKHVMRSA